MHVANISASLLYGLSWMLLGVAALMIALAIATQLGIATVPVTTLTDLICSALAFLCRSLAHKFKQEA